MVLLTPWRHNRIQNLKRLSLLCAGGSILLSIALVLSGIVPLPNNLQLLFATEARQPAAAWWSIYPHYDNGWPVKHYITSAEPVAGWCNANFETCPLPSYFSASLENAPSVQTVVRYVMPGYYSGWQPYQGPTVTGSLPEVSPGSGVRLDWACQDWQNRSGTSPGTCGSTDIFGNCNYGAPSQSGTTYYSYSPAVGTNFTAGSHVGTVYVYPTQTTTYSMYCPSSGWSTNPGTVAPMPQTPTMSITVTVQPTSITANPTTVDYNSATTFTLNASSVQAGSCKIKNPNNVIIWSDTQNRTNFSNVSISSGAVTVAGTYTLECLDGTNGSLRTGTTAVGLNPYVALSACNTLGSCSTSAGTPVAVNAGTAATLSWQSSGMVPNSCAVTKSTGGTVGSAVNTASNVSSGALNQNTVFTLTCLEPQSSSNPWTLSNLSAIDQVKDIPGASYAVWNSGDTDLTSPLITNANLTWRSPSSVSTFGLTRASMAPASGKWYWEVKVVSAAGDLMIGIHRSATKPNGLFLGHDLNGYGYLASDGWRYHAGASAYGATFTNGDVIGVAWDADNGRLFFSKNGVWQSSGNPATGANPAYSGIVGDYAPAVSDAVGGSSVTSSVTLNAGQGGASGLTYSSAAGGYFTYTPPGGFKALSAANVSSVIGIPAQYFGIKTWSGTGGSQNVGGLGFAPDVVWIKNRTTNNWHTLADTLRGALKSLFTNSTSVQTTSDSNGYVSAFLANGFSVSAGASTAGNTNALGSNYVSYLWKEGTTPGLDIVTYTGNGATQSVSHALGAVPAFIMLKDTATNGGNWYVWHQNLSASGNFLILNSLGAESPQSLGNLWNSGTRSATSFAVGPSNLNNTAGVPFVAYVWKEVSGFSKFGKYTGNGSADGAMVYTGFTPRLVMLKRIDAAGLTYGWNIYDTERQTYNGGSSPLVRADSGSAEVLVSQGGSGGAIDLYANGFKLRGTHQDFNANGGTYVYAAFAELPAAAVASAEPEYSLRFDSSRPSYFTRMFGTGDRTKWTVSLWIKRGKLGSVQHLFGTTNTADYVAFTAADALQVVTQNGASLITMPLYRDPAAWMHVVLAVDTAQSINTNRVKLYVDGQLVTQYSVATYPAQNSQTTINSAVGHGLAYAGNSGQTFDGYLASVDFVDGSALTPSSFGATDSAGHWQPAMYGGSFGNTGFHLSFDNTSSLGADDRPPVSRTAQASVELDSCTDIADTQAPGVVLAGCQEPVPSPAGACIPSGSTYESSSNSCVASAVTIGSFSASPRAVRRGVATPVTFSWSGSGLAHISPLVASPTLAAVTCSLSGGGLNASGLTGGIAVRTVTIFQPTNITLTCGTATRTLTIGILPTFKEI